jgi:DtxR family transcriptional regulator, Mn-dependent transcriptional regulator
MTENITNASQNYLKAIYDLTAAGEAASTNALAARLGIAPASVTGMLQKMAAAHPPLVKYRKHQGVTLTRAGERAALEVIRHHRLLETYLHQNLGYSWDEVHDEAERLEHVISEDFEARIADALGHPKRDPHGDPIPTASLTMPRTREVPLSRIHAGQRAIVRRVRAEDPALLRHLQELGLVPGARVRIVEQSNFDGTVRLSLRGTQTTLGPAVSSLVYAEVQRVSTKGTS